jgi:hypothetical protein
MIIIGIILAFVAFGYLCWLIFALAVYALPLFAGITAGLAPPITVIRDKSQRLLWLRL